VEEITIGTGLSLSSGTLSNTAPDQTVALTGGSGISVSGTYPTFTITNTGGGGGGVDSWTLQGGYASTTLSASETFCYGYFYGSPPVIVFNARASRQIRAVKTGFIKKVAIMTAAGTFSTTSPPDFMSIQIRNVTQSTTLIVDNAYVMSSGAFFGQSRQQLYTGFNFAVTENDVLEIRNVTPAWATAPTNVSQIATLYFESV
jgi:hypothetical protein